MRRRPNSPRLPAPVKLLGIAIGAALLFRTFGYEAFNIPSGSMMPALMAGDTVLVSKLSYGLSRYSFPIWQPPFAGRIFGAMPHRGDVAVFRLPRDPEQDYIKRIVGLPGDRVQMAAGALVINGTPVPQERVADFLDPDDAQGKRTRQFTETLPGGAVHPFLKEQDHAKLDDTEVFVVPPGHLFVMGDNRDVSEDSRAMDAVGFVPIENLVGRAVLRLFSLGGQAKWWQLWRWPAELRTNRLLTTVS